MLRSFACLFIFLTVGCATYSYEKEGISDKCCINREPETELYYYIYEKNFPGDSGAYSEIKKALSEKGLKEIEGGKKEPIPIGDTISFGSPSESDLKTKKQLLEQNIRKKEEERRNLCHQYPNLIILSVEYLSYYDASGGDFLTGLSCGLIPSWYSLAPFQRYTFQVLKKCKPVGYYSFVEYHKSFNWLFSIPFAQLSRYKESGPNVGKGIITKVFGDADKKNGL